eukprot:353088-Chlamydomonas_euryale.AAC.8
MVVQERRQSPKSIPYYIGLDTSSSGGTMFFISFCCGSAAHHDYFTIAPGELYFRKKRYGDVDRILRDFKADPFYKCVGEKDAGKGGAQGSMGGGGCRIHGMLAEESHGPERHVGGEVLGTQVHPAWGRKARGWWWSVARRFAHATCVLFCVPKRTLAKGIGQVALVVSIFCAPPRALAKGIGWVTLEGRPAGAC